MSGTCECDRKRPYDPEPHATNNQQQANEQAARLAEIEARKGTVAHLLEAYRASLEGRHAYRETESVFRRLPDSFLNLYAKDVKPENITKIISDYLKTNNLTALSTSSGLRYIIQKAGVGEAAKKGNVAYIHYAGFLLDGKIFDTSLAEVAKANNFNNGPRNEPYRVSVAMQEVVAGWDEMIQLMNKGMKVTVFIPSYLGYGAQGSGIVPPNAVMKFDMELVELK